MTTWQRTGQTGPAGGAKPAPAGRPTVTGGPAVVANKVAANPPGHANGGTNEALPRCTWASGDPLTATYHDATWGIPERDGRAMWEKLVLQSFEAGISWATILRKREAFRAAFCNFEPEHVAGLAERDIACVLMDAGVIRLKANIAGAIASARAYVAMRERGEDFGTFVWGLTGGVPIRNRWRSQREVPSQTPLSVAVSKALKERGFSFVGPSTVYAWMQACGLVNDHLVCCFRHAPVAMLAAQFRPGLAVSATQGTTAVAASASA